MWTQYLAAFLVGAATGGWWSRRKAVATAVSKALAAASATAVATGGAVYVGVGHEQLGEFDPEQWALIQARRAAAAVHASSGHDDYYDDGFANDYRAGSGADRLGLRRGNPAGADSDLCRGLGHPGTPLDRGQARNVTHAVNLWGKP